MYLLSLGAAVISRAVISVFFGVKTGCGSKGCAGGKKTDRL
jgi:hypothetical protein